MEQHRILIISERQADQRQLTECLQRARPQRFVIVEGSDALQRPLDALLDASVGAVILAERPHSEYLLRLALKHRATVPIILLVDDASDIDPERLQALGAQDYLVRSQLQDSLVHRVLDYNIQLRRARQTIEQLSNRDGLTGALNRVGFRDHLERAMQRSQHYGFASALLYINIDRFSTINDHYGETNGDFMISTLAQRLTNKLRSNDSVARLAGDEFAVILEDVGSSTDVEMVASGMLTSLAAPVVLGDNQVSVDVSIGAAMYPDNGEDFPELVEAARGAMLQAKAVEGGKFMRYSGELQFDVEGSNSLAAELRTAARKNQFELHYQPRMDLQTGQLAGLEALLRWNHPQRGLICPGEFLAECEDMGLMKTIGYQVIQHACHAINWLEDQDMTKVDVAVNVSFSQIQDERFLGVVKDILERTGANPQRLEFELTEGTILKSPGAIKARMDDLRLLGVSFSLDDFGTGFSQLTHLTELPISALKIDASFVRELPHNTQQAAVCCMIIDMAEKLGMTVIAEGAENYEQVGCLRDNRCHQVQGFYYSQAIPLQRLPRFVQEQRFKLSERIVP